MNTAIKYLSLFFFLFFCALPFSSSTRMVGYYGIYSGYGGQTGCPQPLTPDRVPAELYTHIVFSFVFINPDHTVQIPTPETLQYFHQVQDLKLRNPNLKVMISLGGWSMDMSLYSNAVATASSRATLVASVMSYLRTYGWDGVDFDWEYPNDPTRGGNPQDPQNFALFMQQMRQAVENEVIPAGKSKIILSIPLPGGAYHGQNYIMPSMIENLDFANIMAYNLHGPWENVVYCSANFYDGTPANGPYHGYSIYDAVQYFLHQNGSSLPAEKFNLGVTFAGVAFKLANTNNFTPGSSAIGEGSGGVCTKEAGYMAYFEVETLLSSGTIHPSFDSVGYCKYFVTGNQWIGYDDAETLSSKVGLVEQMGLGGISVWAMYAESATGNVLQNAIHSALYPEAQVPSSSTSSSSSSLPTPPVPSGSLPTPPVTLPSSSTSSASGLNPPAPTSSSSGSGSSTSSSSGSASSSSSTSTFVSINFEDSISSCSSLLIGLVSYILYALGITVTL